MDLITLLYLQIAHIFRWLTWLHPHVSSFCILILKKMSSFPLFFFSAVETEWKWPRQCMCLSSLSFCSSVWVKLSAASPKPVLPADTPSLCLFSIELTHRCSSPVDSSPYSSAVFHVSTQSQAFFHFLFETIWFILSIGGKLGQKSFSLKVFSLEFFHSYLTDLVSGWSVCWLWFI